MKIKEGKNGFSSVFIMFITVFIMLFIIPIAVLYLIFKLFATPFDYIKYKRSRYQRDFPHKYSWLDEPHLDNKVYTVIKEKQLPIEYIKWSEDYDLHGYFIYKDILLDFTEPFFFDKEKKIFLHYLRKAESEESEYIIDGDETDDADEYLTVEAIKESILEELRNNVPDRECHKIVFFYSRKKVESYYKKEGLDAMQELNDFIIYEKNGLEKAIKDFIDNN